MNPRRLGLVAIVALAACRGAGDGGHAPAHTGTAAGEASDSVPVAARPGATIEVGLEPGELETVVTGAVDLTSLPDQPPFEVALRSAEPAAGHARRFGTITLPIALRRSPALTQYPCTSCHLGTRLVMTDDRKADAHQNIQPVHPKATGAVCSTCHAADNVELLALRSGERPPLDHAYRLCAQCHFAQAEAWAGGGHGKRLDGWQGRRVVMGCSDCHNPHTPALEPRMPFRAPQLERPRGSVR